MPTLTWLTREADLRLSQSAPYRFLDTIPELSYGDPESVNMLIQGDNLDGLKALLPYYAGQVKCVYIDPPFNTEQAFENYNDNLEHTQWLSIIFPRLELLRDLLSEDGCIFVHIDDNEMAYLVTIMDEIFGRRNRISIITFKQGSATGHKAINPGMVTTTNFILLYAKSKDRWKPNRVFTGRERDTRYGQFINNYDDIYENWQLIPLSKAFSNHMGKSIKELKHELGEKFEEQLNEFVIKHAERIIRPARPDYKSVGESARKAIDESKTNSQKVFLLKRTSYPDMYFNKGERWLFYRDKLKEIDGALIAGEPLTNLWDDILSNNLHNEGNISFPKGKKPEGLIKRVFEMITLPGDLILDSFLGSGTSCAVAHKMKLRYIGIEMGEHAVTHCFPRLKQVVDGEQGGISKSVSWQGGGGFRFYRLGEAVFDDAGKINGNIRFATLAAHIWFCETGTPLTSEVSSAFLGIHKDIAYHLLFNGILGDKRPAGGNVLTSSVLRDLHPHEGKKVIYGETSRLTAERMRLEQITFKQIPYDVKAR